MTSEKKSPMRCYYNLINRKDNLSPSQHRILNIFFTTTVIGTFIAMLGIILYYIYAYASLANGSHAFDWLLGIFSDFITIMDASLNDSPYVCSGASYPPLAIAILTPFAWICKSVFGEYAGMNLTVDELTSKIIRHPEFWISIVSFFLICSLAIIWIIIKRYRLSPINSLKVAIIILLSSPFVDAIMRGNTIYFALIFSLLFFLLHDHPHPIARELSYIFLALGGMIKIYPLFFGVFLLHKRKWFASFRVALYFAVGMFLSFFFYPEGLGNVSPFLQQLGNFMSESERLLSGKNLSITALLYKIFFFLSNGSFSQNVFYAVNLLLIALVFIIAAVTASFTKSNFSRCTIASAIILLIPSISYFYVLVFEILPFMEFIHSYDTIQKKKRTVYSVFFFFLFFTFSVLAKNFLFHSLIILVMLCMECVHVIRKEIIPSVALRKSK